MPFDPDPSSFHGCRAAGRAARSLAYFGLLVGLSACQTYRPSPLDSSLHAAGWQERSPSSEPVLEFARKLAEAAPDTSVRFDPSDGLTLAEGEVVALVFNPELRVARLKAGAAKAAAEHAGRWDDPQLGFDVLKVTDGVPDPWVVSSALALTIPVSGRLQIEKARAEAALHSELARVAEEEWNTLKALRVAWLTWSADRLRLEEAERIVTALDSVIETTGKLAEGGELLRTESALFGIEQESRRADVERLRGAVKEGEQEIRTLLGLSPTAPARLLPAIAITSAARSGVNLEECNPTLVRLRSDYDLAERNLQREIRRQFPDIVLGPQGEDDQGQSKIGFVGAIPIPLLNANREGIATALAERDVARAAFEARIELIEGRLAALGARLTGARSRRDSITAKIVPLVDQQVEDAKRLLELGEGGSLVLLESLVRAHGAKLDLIEAQVEEGTTQVEIRHLLGPDRLHVIQ